jgi:charged multivesicular body protein 4
MEEAGRAMKQIHGKLNIDRVDATMEELREQHALGEEIATAITNAPLGETVDESELDDELAELEQEQLDDKMLKTGNVPVSDQVHRLPAVANGEGMLIAPSHVGVSGGMGTNNLQVRSKPVRQEEDDEEEELRKLQAEMAM